MIDTASHTIYVVATIEDSFDHIHHQLIGLDTLTGAVKVSVNADPGGGQNSLNIQQRTGLALGNGRVYIGFGGYNGDCGPYHGWLVSLAENGTGKVAFDVTPTGGLGRDLGDGRRDDRRRRQRLRVDRQSRPTAATTSARAC